MVENNAQPLTEPHPSPIFDTGPHPDPLRPLEADTEPDPWAPHAFSELENFDTDVFLPPLGGSGHAEPVAVPAQPVAVAGSQHCVKRWQFTSIVAVVWALAAAAGLGFYFWWYTSMDKTAPVFGVLLYLIVCIVASLLTSMVENRPPVTALSIALMSAPMASTAAAAVLHGAYFFEWIARPTIG